MIGARRASRFLFSAALLAASAIASSCSDAAPGSASAADAPERRTAPPAFVETAASSGIDFRHRNGARGELFYPELMQGGAALLDYDSDGGLDVFLVQSGPLPSTGDPAATDRLWRNRGDGSFEERTEAAGLGDADYGSGAAAADYDGDGWVDLYVTNLGPNRLWRNRGDGSFEDVTVRAGVGDSGYSTSAVFVDYDADGDLDLYVCNYVEWSPAVEKVCLGPMGLRAYCSPGEYEPQRHTLYRSRGDGTFADVSVAAGIAARPSTGLGVAAADFDGDGLVDLYVANDQRPNFLWINNGDGTFREEALERGCALSGLGFPEAGMGVHAADPDADGDWDLFVVNLSGEGATFYRNLGQGSFVDATDELRLGAPTQPYTGFGAALFDYDGDAWLDVFVANGKVLPGDALAVLGEAEAASAPVRGERAAAELGASRSGAGPIAPSFDYREPNLLLRGLPDGTFVNVTSDAGPALQLLEVSRAAAFGDVEGDGDLDVLIANNAGPARLLRNQVGNARRWLAVRLRDPTAGNRDGLGAEVTVSAAGRVQRRIVQPAYSYCASNELAARFGLGDAGRVDELEILWPDGERQRWRNLAPDRTLVVERPVRVGGAGEGGSRAARQARETSG